MHREFRVAPWPALLSIVSLGGTLLLLGVSWVASTQIPRLGAAGVVGTLVAFVPLSVLPISALFVVMGYELRGRELRVRRLLWTTVIPLGGLTRAALAPDLLQGSLRLVGNGGLYSFTGTYYKRDLGRYRALVTDWRRSVLLEVDGKKIAVSPAEPQAFVRALSQAFPTVAAH